MTDTWLKFWKDSPLSDTNGVNLRPDTYRVDKAVDHVNASLNLTEQHSLLDVGCGNGLALREFAKHTAHLTGCDVSGNMVALVNAKKLAVAVVADATSLPFPDESFDCVVCLAVLQYFSSIVQARQAVYEMYRVCKTDGIIFIGDIPDARVMKSQSGLTSFFPEELGSGYHFKFTPAYFEPERRFDLIIRKQL